MSESELLTQRVCEFITRETRYPLRKITPETTLAWDIGLAGGDAVELFDAFAREFAIERESFSRLDFRQQFGDEGSWGCLSVLPFFWPDRWLHGHDVQWIRVKDLIAAAEQKKWLKP